MCFIVGFVDELWLGVLDLGDFHLHRQLLSLCFFGEEVIVFIEVNF